MSFRKSRDANEAGIVKALETMGATVTRMDAMRSGCPDLLVGYRGETILMEVKNPATKHSGSARIPAASTRPGGEYEGMHPALLRTQADWIREWQGGPVYVVETAAEAMALLANHSRACSLSPSPSALS